MTRRRNRQHAPSPRRAAAVLALAFLLLAPAVLGAHTAGVVTGHTTYWNFDGTDPCLGAIAGMLRLQVLWFDDRVLFTQEDLHGKRFILATEHGAPSPKTDSEGQPRRLYTDGVRYNFTDPNGITWNVTEAYYLVNTTRKASTSGSDQVDPTSSTTVDASAGIVKYYTWIVRMGNSTFDASIQNYYNFVDVLDTCKFNSWIHGHPANQTAPGSWQPANATTNQTAQAYQVDLWVAEHPDVVDLGYDVPSQFGAHHGSNDTANAR